MPLFKTYPPHTQKIKGKSVLVIFKGLSGFKDNATKILANNGIVDPDPESWYDMQGFLNAFKEISDKMGASTLFSIGQKIPETAVFPPAIDSFDKAMASIDIAYHMNHKDGEIGTLKFLGRTGTKEAQMYCKNPYPCDFDRGVIEAMAKKFKPENSISVSVKHDDTKECRKKGAESCSYIISWI